ncbi:Proline-rich protein HUA1 [Candida viswanathii]|uniref:Proline-rich protein HUA1 n=1 Tax=Candida viswanathii TaxID=5486 RepID=A0A367YH27_9ASCO|nr:Proline-rich protein HUA1 [Candida viswanathii]RCK66571.1 Proline-rich protein HUA1 [Candida viswanathii]
MPLTNRPKTDELPPPSYDDAIKDTLVVERDPAAAASSSSSSAPALPQRRQQAPRPAQQPSSTSSSSSHLTVPQTRPHEHRTNSSASAHSASSASSRRTNDSQYQSSDLYTNNKNLPFNYTRGYYCKKCKNSGYRSSKEICRPCWDQFYLNKHAYNPNKDLPFKYPKRYYCTKCGNTGYKFKNGLTCQNCWSQFGPRNNYSYVNSNFQPHYFGSTTYVPAPGGSAGMPARRVAPGSPELGGLLCGNCRGQGMVHFLFDSDLCPICGGLGRVFSPANPPAGSAPPPPPPPQGPPMHPPYGYGPPPPQQWGGYQYDYNYGRKN